MGPDFEAVANISDWPPNVPGKPTHVAVFGVFHLERGKVCETIWTGDFPDLEPAMYWAAKKETQAVRKDKWIMASRVLWQHDLTPEQAVAAAFKQLEPQLDRAMADIASGGDISNPDMGPGPMKKVDPKNIQGYYAEVIDKNDPEGDPIASFLGGPPSDDLGVDWNAPGRDDEEDDNDVPMDWTPPDPRGE